MGIDKSQSNRQKIHNDKEAESILDKLEDYKGTRLDLAEKYSADLLEKGLSGKYQNSKTVKLEECDNLNPDEMEKIIGAISRSRFKKSFEFGQENANLNPQILVNAAKEIATREACFDPVTKARYEKLKLIIDQIAASKTIANIKKTNPNTKDEEIYGTKGAFNFLLALSRIQDVWCALESDRDKGKVTLAIGARASLVILKAQEIDIGAAIAVNGEGEPEGLVEDDTEKVGTGLKKLSKTVHPPAALPKEQILKLTRITPEQMRTVSAKSQHSLYLNNLTSIDAATMKAMPESVEYLDLSGLSSIDKAIMAAMPEKVEYLGLGCKTLDQVLALGQSLKSKQGLEIVLNSLKNVNDPEKLTKLNNFAIQCNVNIQTPHKGYYSNLSSY